MVIYVFVLMILDTTLYPNIAPLQTLFTTKYTFYKIFFEKRLTFVETRHTIITVEQLFNYSLRMQSTMGGKYD